MSDDFKLMGGEHGVRLQSFVNSVADSDRSAMYSRGRSEFAGLGSGHDGLLEKGEEFSVGGFRRMKDWAKVVRACLRKVDLNPEH